MGGDEPAERAKADKANADPGPRPGPSSGAFAHVLSSPGGLFRLVVIADARKLAEFKRPAAGIAARDQNAQRESRAQPNPFGHDSSPLADRVQSRGFLRGRLAQVKRGTGRRGDDHPIAAFYQ
jgi:hypothetical protein